MKTNSRQIAFEILKKVFKNKAFSNILLNEVAHLEMPQKFKNLIFAIVSGTITNQMLLKNAIDKIIDPKRTNFEIQILLWMSLYQIHFLKMIPQYAVVNEAVSIAKEINSKLSGFVNASLKNAIKNEESLFDNSSLGFEAQVCMNNSFPLKLFAMIKEQFGEEIAVMVAKDSTTKPVISFRVNTLKTSAEQLISEFKNTYKITTTPIENCLVSNEPIFNSQLYTKGLITIQDPASIEVINILNPTPDSRALDMCAAPGGKTTHMSMLMQNTGEILAYELNPNKISLINENITRLGCKNVTTICEDSSLINDNEKFDYILLDAPCSGFGVLKRKPEIKINGYDQDKINKIIKTQKKLIASAYKNLKQGGVMVYSTCTINKNENQNQIKSFLDVHNDMMIISEKQIFGFESQTDGFYICKMIKN